MRRIAVGLLAAFLGACRGGDGIPAFTHFTSIAIADLNDDHLLDLATANVFIAGDPPHPSDVTVSLQQAGTPGVFTTGVDYPVGSDAQFVTTGDLNDDGLISGFRQRLGPDPGSRPGGARRFPRGCRP